MRAKKKSPVENFHFDAKDPSRIPDYVRDQSRTLDVSLGVMRPWWRRPVPAHGIPVVFASRGIYKPGTPGWIIDGQERTVFLGPDAAMKETLVGEFTVVIPNGSQCTAQIGRDIRLVPVQPSMAPSKEVPVISIEDERSSPRRLSA
jgi:hypothetical protein